MAGPRIYWWRGGGSSNHELKCIWRPCRSTTCASPCEIRSASFGRSLRITAWMSKCCKLNGSKTECRDFAFDFERFDAEHAISGELRSSAALGKVRVQEQRRPAAKRPTVARNLGPLHRHMKRPIAAAQAKHASPAMPHASQDRAFIASQPGVRGVTAPSLGERGACPPGSCAFRSCDPNDVQGKCDTHEPMKTATIPSVRASDLPSCKA